MTKRNTDKKRKKRWIIRDTAVSSIIGEMLLIALILILIPGVTISLMHQLPQDRIPTVHILMHAESPNIVSLYHKGGDYIHVDDIEIFVQDVNIGNSWKNVYQAGNQKVTFDLGDVITIPATSGKRINLVAKQAVIFRGVMPNEI